MSSIRALFEEARALPKEERAAFLERECAGDAELRTKVEGLLRADEAAEAAAFLHITESDAPDHERSAAQTGAAPREIGPYRLIEKLGEGGFGVVYVADQLRPIRRKVALKLLRPGPASAEVLTRFEAERQALALMDHPNIAMVYDAGATETGEPYYVMEYVAGAPITDHADRAELGVDDRLRLFLQVCEGVQHAHTKGVIHRDLKPSNVLVTQVGDKALVKVIDFGIAKALGARLTGETLYTQQGMMIGTPEYMSPEQASGAALDTRSDVYSLGVILYELLTGALPFDRRDVPSSGILDFLQLIREKDPPKLSSRLRALKDVDAAAARRRTDAASLGHRLRGDLEWITAKSLEKDPARRYASATAFAEDVTRYLEDRAILARPRSTTYVVRKLVARHRVAAAFSGVLLLSLVGFAIAMSVMYGRQRVERAKAEQMNAFLVSMLSSVDPAQAQGKEVLVRDILDQASATVSTDLAKEPEVEAMLERTMADTYSALGLYEEALKLSRQCVAANERAYGPRHLETAKALAAQGDLEFTVGETDSAIVTLRRALAAGEGSAKKDPELLAFTYDSLANLLGRKGQFAEGDSLFQRALDAAGRMPGADSTAYGSILNGRSLLLREWGRVPQATALAEQVLALWQRKLGPEHPRAITALGNLAALRRAAGENAEAEQMFRRVVDTQEKVLGPEHPNLATNLNNLGLVLGALGRYDEAESTFTRALTIYRAAYGEESAQVAQALNNLGVNFERAERYADAEPPLREAHAIWLKVWGEDHPSTWNTTISLARVLGGEGKFGEADALARRVVQARTAKLGEAHPDVRRARQTVGEIAMKAGRPADAEVQFRACLDALSREEKPSETERAQLQSWVGQCRWKQGDAAGAESLLVVSTPILAKSPASSPWLKNTAIAATVAVLESRGKAADADRVRALQGRSTP